MAVIYSLSLERRLEAAFEVVYDMLENRKAPDILTYRTLLEEMCREGRSEVAYDLLEELPQRKGTIKGRIHSDLLASLHWEKDVACLHHGDNWSQPTAVWNEEEKGQKSIGSLASQRWPVPGLLRRSDVRGGVGGEPGGGNSSNPPPPLCLAATENKSTKPPPSGE
ncbi:hypothetical protein ZIOFF_067646 [Zingiber officinale]|uniref:Pentatricopeptide repeat-containing protein n=1 Tax=Zingiber officinale TaxID=94328 RepID=A0A8J5CFV3_ZINOF|nr:hypothetical protein ZIOFF_067646 [Zingiber officinale]